MEFENFDLHVNPYDYLGLPRGCRDLKQIKRAYRKKSLELHPDRRTCLDADFPTLHKCYIYLKTLSAELDGSMYNYNPEDRMREMRGTYDSFRASSSGGNSNLHRNGGSVNYPSDNRGYDADYYRSDYTDYGNSRETYRQQQQKAPNFEQPVADNSMIPEDDFNHDRILQEMLSYRPVSTSYDVGGVGETSRPPQHIKTLEQFNQHFASQQQQQQQQQQSDLSLNSHVDGFTGFDEVAGAATVVTDGQFLFVQSPQRGTATNGDTSLSLTPPCTYGLLKDVPEYDRGLEQERFSNPSNDTLVSDKDLHSFTRLRSACGESNQRKLNTAQFADRMRFMDAQHREQLRTQRLQNQSVVDAQMQRLSETTRANLHNHLLIEGRR